MTGAKESVHVPFSWLDPELVGNPNGEFVALTMDICRGVEVCLGLVHSSDLERRFLADADEGDTALPTISSCESEWLLRLALKSTKLLADAAERHIGDMNNSVLIRRAP